ncbi:MAG: hypothetical protein ACE5E6_12370 [Phycisphaerae bacterium]
MQRIVCSLAAACVLMVFAGCTGATLTMNPHERARQLDRIARHDRMALQDDIDLVLQNDRNTRLTRWHDR